MGLPEDRDGGFGSRKEEILRQSPLTRAFVSDLVFSNITSWRDNLSQEFAKVDQDISESWGDDWKTETVFQELAYFDSLDVFNPDLSKQITRGITLFMIGIGFEVGDFSDCRQVFPEIATQLCKIGFFKETRQTDEKVRERAEICVTQLLIIGEYLRKSFLPEEYGIPPAFLGSS